MNAIVALGNPGERYAQTPHNVGFATIDRLVDALQCQPWRESRRFHAHVTELRGIECILFAKPDTFMNLSGESVRSIVSMYKISPDQLWIIHDDYDLPIGTVRHSYDSRSAGHNGVQSIIDAIGTKEFHRIRIGVQPPDSPRQRAEEYVLQRFADKQWQALIDTAVAQSQSILREIFATEPGVN